MRIYYGKSEEIHKFPKVATIGGSGVDGGCDLNKTESNEEVTGLAREKTDRQKDEAMPIEGWGDPTWGSSEKPIHGN